MATPKDLKLLNTIKKELSKYKKMFLEDGDISCEELTALEAKVQKIETYMNKKKTSPSSMTRQKALKAMDDIQSFVNELKKEFNHN